MSTDASADPARSRLFVHSVEKSFGVLEAFRGTRYLALHELARRCGVDKSTAQRMTHTLLQLGYLEQCAATRRFALSTRLLELSYHFLRNHPLVERAAPILIALRRQCGERVDLSLLADGSLVYALRLPSRGDHAHTNLVGRRVPLFCTAGGRAVLARLAEDEAGRIVRDAERTPLTRFTQTDPGRIMAEVATARRDGYAVARDEVIENEVVAAACVTDGDGRPVGAVHVAGLSAQWTDADFVGHVLPGLLHAAARLSGRDV